MSIDSNDQSPNLEQLMYMGVQAAKSNNPANARIFFQQILDRDKEHERAWLWMAAVAETPTDRVRYLKTVLRINPNNQTALGELEKMKTKTASSNTQVIRYGAVVLILLLFLVALAILALIIL